MKKKISYLLVLLGFILVYYTTFWFVGVVLFVLGLYLYSRSEVM